MNFIKILDTLSNKDLLSKAGSRRDSFDQFKKLGTTVALASIPFGLAATSSKSKAANRMMAGPMGTNSNTDVLNFALTLEYLERSYYQQGLDAAGLIPSADQTVFATISKHEDAHVEFLLAALGDAAIDEPTFDFTGAPGGLNLNPFGDYPTFLALAQGFEDTGVRAYKGQAGALANDNDLLQYALQIHSVEARHAAQVRRMRDEKDGLPNLKTLYRLPLQVFMVVPLLNLIKHKVVLIWQESLVPLVEMMRLQKPLTNL